MMAAQHLQRKCACGGTPGPSGKCDACRQKRLLLHRKIQMAPPEHEISAQRIAHDVIRAPGHPLDSDTRAFMEPRFGHDFGRVRVHTDARAARSADAMGARAYVIGKHLVLGSGEDGRTRSGRSLLAHELAHVLQQGTSTVSFDTISPADSAAEREADNIADQVTGGQPVDLVQHTGRQRLMRKLRVDRPADPIPNPTGQGLVQTNAQTVEGYLRTISPQGSVEVDRTSGEVDIATGFCPGILGGLVQGFLSGARIGSRAFGGIPILSQVGALVGGVIGGLVGAVGGLFGASISPAAASATPTGATCLCDFIDSSQQWTIEINDAEAPHTLEGRRIWTPSPNSQRIWGAATVSGRLAAADPWLALGHELCGHAWLEMKEQEEMAAGASEPFAYRDPQTGQIITSGQPRAEQALRHQRSVERENLLRAEHGLEARGYRLRDPYCGESFWRERGAPAGEARWQELHGVPGFETYLAQCEYLRSQLPENRNGRYRIHERIP